MTTSWPGGLGFVSSWSFGCWLMSRCKLPLSHEGWTHVGYLIQKNVTGFSQRKYAFQLQWPRWPKIEILQIKIVPWFSYKAPFVLVQRAIPHLKDVGFVSGVKAEFFSSFFKKWLFQVLSRWGFGFFLMKVTQTLQLFCWDVNCFRWIFFFGELRKHHAVKEHV